MKNPNVPMVADARAIDLLQRIATRLDDLHRLLASQVAVLPPSSNRPVVDTHRDTSPESLLTATDVAHLLAIDGRTLRELRHAGEAPPEIVVGRRPRWRKGDVEQWISKRRAK